MSRKSSYTAIRNAVVIFSDDSSGVLTLSLGCGLADHLQFASICGGRLAFLHCPGIYTTAFLNVVKVNSTAEIHFEVLLAAHQPCPGKIGCLSS